MRSRVVVILAGCLLSTLNTAAAQKDSVSHPARKPAPALAWMVPVGIAASVAIDPEAREWTLRERTRSLDRFAKADAIRRRFTAGDRAKDHAASQVTTQGASGTAMINAAPVQAVLIIVVGRRFDPSTLLFESHDAFF